MNDYEGLIIKGIGGFYYVKTAGELYICKAKGIFRKDKIKPLPGDKVHISVDYNDDGIINSIMPRKNLPAPFQVLTSTYLTEHEYSSQESKNNVYRAHPPSTKLNLSQLFIPKKYQ